MIATATTHARSDHMSFYWIDRWLFARWAFPFCAFPSRPDDSHATSCVLAPPPSLGPSATNICFQSWYAEPKFRCLVRVMKTYPQFSLDSWNLWSLFSSSNFALFAANLSIPCDPRKELCSSQLGLSRRNYLKTWANCSCCRESNFALFSARLNCIRSETANLA